MSTSSDDEIPLSKIRERRRTVEQKLKLPAVDDNQSSFIVKRASTRTMVITVAKKLKKTIKQTRDKSAVKQKRKASLLVKKRRSISNVKKEDSSDDDYDELSATKTQGKEKATKPILTCPHCFKVISTKLGLQYHIDNFVCRKNEKNGNSPGKKSGKETTKDKKTAEKLPKRRRTNSNNMASVESTDDEDSNDADQYHIENFACRKNQKNGNNSPEKQSGKETTKDGGIAEKLPKRRRANSNNMAAVENTDDEDSNDADQYKMENFVCRKNQKNGNSPEKKSGKKTTKNGGTAEKLPKRRRTNSNNMAAVENTDDEDSNDSYQIDDDSNDDSTSDDDETQARQKTHKKTSRRRGAEEDRTCLHCLKVISTKLGLQYHIDNFVCRKNQNNGNSPGKKSGKKTTKNGGTAEKLPKRRQTNSNNVAAVENTDDEDSNDADQIDEDSNDDSTSDDVETQAIQKTHKKTSRRRGAEEDRTCPHCLKVISTKLGLQYHIDNFVCRKNQKNGNSPGKKSGKKTTKDGGTAEKLPKRRQTNSNNVAAVENTDDEDSNDADQIDEDSNDDSTSDDVETQAIQKTHKKTSRRREAEEDRTCPHCLKVISTKLGLQYHIDNFVCKKKQATSSNASSKRRRGKGIATGSKKERGKAEDRTCPMCSRVFTSVLGCRYHVQHQVCIKSGDTDKDAPCDTLNAGSRFVTQFGIVEVVRDDRAIPTAVLSEDIKVLQKRFNSYKDRVERQRLRAQANCTVLSRLRRHRLNQLFVTNDFSAQHMRHAYFGDQKRSLPKSEEALTWSHDPSFPEGSFPDRMVECKLIPDQRARVFDVNEYRDNGQKLVPDTPFETKLFLRRRLLNKPYVENIVIYVCASCGAEYNSKDGFVYHARSEACTRKQQTRLDSARDYLNAIEERINRSLRTNRFTDNKRRLMQNLAVYPEVWQSLGFKILPLFNMELDIEIDDDDILEVEEPEETLISLRQQLRLERDLELGAVYPSVWKSLGFRRPNSASKRKNLPGDRIQSKRRKKAPDVVIETPAKFIFPPPPIIDMQVLVDEADTGRYPTVQRFTEDHDAECKICKKESGTVYMCTFCPKVVHLTCMRTKVAIKDPEPENDFMCHSCIKFILSRRRRAEKRRFQKQEATLERAACRRDAEAAAAEERTKALEAEPQFLSEYHRVAFMGQELSELIELLADANSRMNQLAVACRANGIRRSQL